LQGRRRRNEGPDSERRSLPRRLRDLLAHSTERHARHDPVVIFEISSPSTANDDLGAKRLEYQALPSVQSYIVLKQTHRSAQVFRRVGETASDDEKAAEWTFEFIVGPDAAIALPEIGVTIPLAEIYNDVLPEGEQAPP
jgi:Uma2 family endonuclease